MHDSYHKNVTLRVIFDKVTFSFNNYLHIFHFINRIVKLKILIEYIKLIISYKILRLFDI